VDRYVKTGKVRMVFRNLHFIGDDSRTAAQMAAAAGLQNHLWQFIDVFYANQGQENTGYVTDAFLRRMGGSVDGLDVEKAMADRDSAAVQTQLANADDLATTYGLHATPSFLVARKGQQLSTFKPSSLSVDAFADELDKELGG
jgi:protein-disulfide isomerase